MHQFKDIESVVWIRFGLLLKFCTTFFPLVSHCTPSAILTKGAASVRYTIPAKHTRSREEEPIVHANSEPQPTAWGWWDLGFYTPSYSKTGYLSGGRMTLNLLILIIYLVSSPAVHFFHPGLLQKSMGLFLCGRKGNSGSGNQRISNPHKHEPCLLGLDC